MHYMQTTIDATWSKDCEMMLSVLCTGICCLGSTSMCGPVTGASSYSLCILLLIKLQPLVTFSNTWHRELISLVLKWVYKSSITITNIAAMSICYSRSITLHRVHYYCLLTIIIKRAH